MYGAPISAMLFYQAKMYIATAVSPKRVRTEAIVVPGLTAALQRSVVHTQVPVSPSAQSTSGVDAKPQLLEPVVPA